jgi:hypothetical protein
MHLPIYVTGRKPRFRVTFVCPTLHWAGQKLRDFRETYDETEACDETRAPIDASGLARLIALPPPNSAAASKG